ncbi:MAG: asparagine synthase (glutamine-hydrolyzing) [Pirellulales bacterium]
MCGIAGAFDLSGQRGFPESRLRRMIRAIAHRGPDDEQIHVAPGVALANRRLSIVDLAGGRQPLSNEDGSIWVAFEGELFEHREVRAQLAAQGHRFATKCDTEIWVHLYEEVESRVFELAHGQFAVALWDGKRRTGWLGRDRIGIAPLYYAQSNGWLLFASEIKALLASGMLDVRPNVRAIDYFFNFFSMPWQDSAFEGIHFLPPGHYAKIKDGKFEIQTYWDLDFPDRGAEQRFADPNQAVDQFEDLLRGAIQRRLSDEVRVSGYLSGGIDSGVMMALGAQERGEPLPALTIGFDRSGPSDESHLAESTAAQLGSPLQIVTVTERDIANTYPRLIRAAEGPVLDTACACMVLIAEANRAAGNTVALTGEGADEALAGYVWFKWHQVQLTLTNLVGASDGGGVQRMFRRLVGGEARHWPQARGVRDTRMAQQISWELVANSRSTLYADRMWQLLDNYNPYDDLPITAERLKRWHPLNQSIYTAYKVMFPGLQMLAKGDRPVKHASTEGRYPYLDERLVSFCAQIAPEYKLRGWTDKWLLRQLAARLLPSKVARRKKTMFRANLGKSFIGDNHPAWVDELLSDESLQRTGYFDPAGVRQAREAQHNMSRRSLRRFSLDLGLSAVISTQLWHHTYCGGGLADLPTWSPPTVVEPQEVASTSRQPKSTV